MFRSIPKSLKPRPSAAGDLRSSRRPISARLRIEALEERGLPSGIVTLAASDESPLVGDRVTWTATAADVGANPVYQFRTAPRGGAFHVVRDFSPANSFTWTPMQEGSYDIEVTVKDGYQATATTSAVAADAVASRVTGPQPVITPTLNPLVALYSVPPSAAGSVFIQFAVASDHPAWRNTNTLAVVPGKSTNFFVAGMLPNTTYEMRDVFSDGTGSAPQLFTTGSLPTTLTFSTFTVQQAPAAGSDLDQDMVFHSLVFTGPDAASNSHPVATDLSGRVEWYYDTQQSGLGIINMNTATLLPGGTVIGLGNDRDSVRRNRNVLREIDLAGDPVRETNLAAVNAQLAALGHEPIYGFHHDVQRLPDGSLVVLGYPERAVAIDGVPTNYIGEQLVVLDQDLRVVWAWDAFDHLDVSRGPVLGEVTQPGVGPTSVVPGLPAVDWLHVNAVSQSPDGNLVLSMRHQDWVIKIDYANGAGDGHVVWRLGAGGDFALNSADPTAWFSHQHNAHFIDDHTLILFDNGNTRRATDPDAHSRGQVWTLDEATMTATPVLNADLGSYSFALGAAERLSNGSFSFTLGANGSTEPPLPPAHTVEVTPDGTTIYDLQVNKPEYRAYRVRTLYEGVDDALGGAPTTVASVVLNDGSAQRSMIDRITVSFSGPVVLDPGSIELRRQDGSLVDARVTISLVGGKTVAVLTFGGAEFVGGSLADGNYALAVRADRAHDRWGRELDGDGDGSAGGDRVDGFSRLFGDSDGDGDVDRPDRDRFRSAFETAAADAGGLWYFGFDGDGDVDGLDNGQFNRRFSRT